MGTERVESTQGRGSCAWALWTLWLRLMRVAGQPPAQPAGTAGPHRDRHGEGHPATLVREELEPRGPLTARPRTQGVGTPNLAALEAPPAPAADSKSAPLRVRALGKRYVPEVQHLSGLRGSANAPLD